MNSSQESQILVNPGQAFGLDNWQARKEYYRNEYTFTTPVRISTTCEIDKAKMEWMIKNSEAHSFFPFDSIIKNVPAVQNYIKTVLTTHHEVDERLKMPFFIDRVSIKNARTDRVGSILSFGASLELPYVKHTNTLAYRVLSHDHNRFRAIDLKDDLFTFHNGHIHQAIIPVDSMSDCSIDLCNLDMEFNIAVDFGSHSMESTGETIQAIRGRMIHMLDVLDQKLAYPVSEPLSAQRFVQQNGLTNQVFIEPNSYTALWAVDVPKEQMKIMGATFDADHYASVAHSFFQQFSECRISNWDDGGIFISLDGCSIPCKLYFELEMDVSFIVKKHKDEEMNQTTMSAIHTARKYMKQAEDTSDPFKKTKCMAN